MSQVAGIKKTDVFAVVNAALFLIILTTDYMGRFRRYIGRGNVHEFAIYAIFILGAIVALWLYLRKMEFPAWKLLLMEAGILAHFAGGLVSIHGVRLYDTVILGVPFDKYVHFLNALAGSVLLDHVIDLPGRGPHKLLARAVVILLVVLGVGAVVEIVEYLVTLVVPNSGVGGYDNNMQDLIANLVGGGAFMLCRAVVPRVRAPLASARVA